MIAEEVERGLWGVIKKYFIFIALTMWFHLFGPWAYANENLWILFAFMGLFVVVVVQGFRLGLKKPIITTIGNEATYHSGFRWVALSLVIALCIKGGIFFNNSFMGSGIDLSGSVSNMGKVYAEALSRNRGINETSLMVQIETLFGVFVQIGIVGGFYYFSRMKLSLKVLLISVIAIIFANAILFRGTQIAFGSILIYALSVALVVSIKHQKRLFGWKIIVAMIVMFYLFAQIQASRLDAYGVGMENFPLNPLISIKKDHWFFWVFGNNLGFVIAIMVQYFSMGYYGLSMCLNLDFVWTYGLGSSIALSSYANQYLGLPEQLQNSYPLRLEAANGWPALMYWQTIFPWLAGDFTWIGTLMLFGILALCYATSLKEAVLHDNLLSMMLVANLNIMWLFVPANNQLMQTRESTLSFLIVFFLWMVFHKRFNRMILR